MNSKAVIKIPGIFIGILGIPVIVNDLFMVIRSMHFVF